LTYLGVKNTFLDLKIKERINATEKKERKKGNLKKN
jgi:hypothetical protein